MFTAGVFQKAALFETPPIVILSETPRGEHPGFCKGKAGGLL